IRTRLSTRFFRYVIIDRGTPDSTMSTMDCNELWQKVLGEVELQISRHNFITWFKNSSILEKKDGTVTVGLPNNFAREWVENKYHNTIFGTLRTIDSGIRKVEYILTKDSAKLTSNEKKNPDSHPYSDSSNKVVFNESL